MSEKLAICGGSPVRTKPLHAWPVFGKPEEERLLAALNSGVWGRQTGTQVAEFEQKFADYHQTKYGVALVNGTVALRLSLMAAGIGAGDEVIVPPFTFVATASAVVEANATPVFVDIGLDTFNIDPEAIRAAITPRTKAIIPVHFGGLPCDMDAIMDIAARHNLIVLEDACHAHGAEYKGRRMGSIGHMGVFSFQSSKNLTSGEGGIIISNDPELAARSRSVHNCGRMPGRAWYEHFTIGGNYRLSEFQGAILNAQWDRFDEQTKTREINGRYLADRLARIPGFAPQRRGPDCTRHSYHVFMIRIDPDVLGTDRKTLLAALQAEGIPATICYPEPLYRQPMFLNKAFGPYTGYRSARPDYDFQKVSCPNCELLCSQQGIWLEQRLFLGTRQDMDDIAAAFEKVYDNRAALASVAVK
jgi:dTDP-4-amino-4,6-dideoxygalactose transaminase